MTAIASQQSLILADTSPFCRFAEQGVCGLLVDYLDTRLHLTTWVIAELDHRATQPEHKQLEELAGREPPWTVNAPVTLDDASVKRADFLAAGWRREQERKSGVERDPRANLGEATTVVAGLARPGACLLLDDGQPKKFAIAKGISVVTTEDIVVEMTASGDLKHRFGYLLYKRVYNSSEAQFDAAIQRVKLLMA